MKRLTINKIKFNKNIDIEITKKEYIKIIKSINFLNRKYKQELAFFWNLEKESLKKYSFDNMKKDIIYSKKIIIGLIKDAISLYKNKLKGLECVFITGSYSRGTNKISSDLDLHFFYRVKPKNFLYEEIVSYIICSVLKKPRDSIDPTFILNLENNKEKVSKLMNKSVLEITLNSSLGRINYSYKIGKKRRFYLQYLNSRKLSKLKKYIIDQIDDGNYEYNHCFEIIYGKSSFNKIYKEILEKEFQVINLDYILKKINELIIELNIKRKLENNRIYSIKQFYQSYNFKLIYEYYSILRYLLLYKKNNVKYFNLFEIMNNYADKRKIFEDIYKYFWLVEKMANYCICNNKDYGLHSTEILFYNFSDLDRQWDIIKQKIIVSLKEEREKICQKLY